MSGELKHGPLAMVDANMRVIMIVMKDRLYEVHKASNQIILFVLQFHWLIYAIVAIR